MPNWPKISGKFLEKVKREAEPKLKGRVVAAYANALELSTVTKGEKTGSIQRSKRKRA